MNYGFDAGLSSGIELDKWFEEAEVGTGTAIMITDHWDATPMRCFFAAMGSVIMPYARFLHFDDEQGKWKLYSPDKYKDIVN